MYGLKNFLRPVGGSPVGDDGNLFFLTIKFAPGGVNVALTAGDNGVEIGGTVSFRSFSESSSIGVF